MQSIELPSSPSHVALLQFLLHLDTDPGQAQYRIEGRFGTPKEDWLLLSEGTNAFGGYHTETVAAHLEAGQLAEAKFLEVRFGMMFKQAATYKTDLPTVALGTVSNSPPYLTGTIDFWGQLSGKPASEQG